MRKYIFFLFALSLYFVSCDSQDSEILDVTLSCVLDFKDEKTAADSHISVFVQINNELQRAEKVEVKNIEKNYIWNIQNPTLITSDNKKWAGSSNLVYPLGQSIENGKYLVTYEDAAGNECSKEVNFDFNKQILSCKSDEVRPLMKGSVTENYALYDEEDKLIFFGRKKSNWHNDKNILSDYKNCEYMRVCYVSTKSLVISLMPPKKIKQDSND